MSISHQTHGELVVINSPDYPKIDGAINAYIGVIEHWGETNIGTVEQMKTLALDGSNKVICEISFSVNKQTLIANVVESLDLAKKCDATQVVLVQNKPFKSVVPNGRENSDYKRFVAFAKAKGLDVKDTLLVSDNSYYSYTESAQSSD